MSNSTLFDGSFCRKPTQNLGGKRPCDDRETLLQKARLEREKRERERLMAQSIVVVQAAVRSFLARCALKRKYRSEFMANRKHDYGHKELGNQICLINQFFDIKQDIDKLNELAKDILAERDYILKQCYNQDYIWTGRIGLFLRKCVATSGVKRSVAFLRVLEVVTEEKFELNGPSSFLVNIWIDLINSGNFFDVWRGLLLAVQTPNVKIAYFDILKRPMALIKRLSTITESRFTSRNKRVSGQNVVDTIFTYFTAGICRDILQRNSQLIEVFEHMTMDFPFAEWLNFLQTYPTALPTMDQEEGQLVDCTFDRCVLYSVLRFSQTQSHFDILLLAKTIIKYLHSIDKSYAPDKRVRTDYLFSMNLFREPNMENEEDDLPEFHQYRWEQYSIVNVLTEKVLEKTLPLIELINTQTLENWDLYYQFVSTMVCLDQRTAVKVPYLSAISFKKDLLRAAFLKIFQGRQKTVYQEVLGFCWGFNHLLNVLHDDEFLSAIPMKDVQELKVFIRFLIDLYEDITLKENIKYTILINAVKYVILWSLRQLHDRNTRLLYLPEDCFISRMACIYLPVETHSLDFGDFSQAFILLYGGQMFYLNSFMERSMPEEKLLQLLNEAPFLLSFDNRITVWHRLLDNYRLNSDIPIHAADHIQIRRSMLYEDAYEKLSSENVPDLRVNVRISLVNIVGAPEAGVDGGGLLREFLTEATKAGVDPNRGFFRLDSQNRIYPNPVAKKVEPNYRSHFYLMGRLVGKALYEQILLELPLAAFFIQTCISRHVPTPVDYLATLDPALHKNLLNLKTYEGDWNALGLDFTVVNDEFGQFRSIELKKNGANISVDKENIIEYIHLVAQYKINKETEEECRFFRMGLTEIIPNLRMFSWREMQTLISGSDKPIDVQDWKSHTNYAGGYAPEDATVQLFWEVVESFEEEYLRKLLKFVTSCSRPPLLGFKDLVPNFGIQNAGVTDRLPTAATCLNLLKLPQYTDSATLRQKLRYVVDAQAGFELS